MEETHRVNLSDSKGGYISLYHQLLWFLSPKMLKVMWVGEEWFLQSCS